MSQFGKDSEDFSACRTVRITGSENTDNYTVYIIEVSIGPYSWTVKHRYSDFYELHDKLVSSFKVDKNLLPPKKLFGNQSESFIKRRQNDLELYLQTILYYLAQRVPPVFAYFLDFHKYEIHGITQALAEDLYNRGELILQTKEPFEMTALHLYALTERLKLPEPTCDSGDVKKDIGHILDFITRLKNLKIYGSRKCVGTSNIDMRQLKFDLTLFKSLQSLEMLDCNCLLISGFETIKQTLQKIEVHLCVTDIKETTLQEFSHWRDEDGCTVVAFWNHITYADFSHNQIKSIDESVQLMPVVEHLALNHNQIDVIQNLQWLSQLTYLDLSNNQISHLDALHTKLGNIKTLNLAGNKLQTLQGLSKLFCLETLDISYNEIDEIMEIKHVCGLPCLENLLLTGNSVTIVLDYRTRVLAMFEERAFELCLDNQKPTQKELDTVAVIQAIQKSKETKEKLKRNTTFRQFTSVVPIDEETTPRFTDFQELSYPEVAADSSSNAQSPALHLGHQCQLEDSAEHGDTSDLQPCDSQSSVLHKSKSQISTVDFSYTNTRLFQQKSETLTASEDTGRDVYRLMSLPTMADQHFCTTLLKKLLDKDNQGTYQLNESVQQLFWCYIIHCKYSEEFSPACVAITEKRILIQHLGMPDKIPYYSLLLGNLQQIVIGQSYNCIQLEESFIGSSGKFILYGLESSHTLQFVESLQNCFSENIELGKVDVVDLSKNPDYLCIINDMEKKWGLFSSEIVFTAVVVSEGGVSTVAISENFVYLLRVNHFYFSPERFTPNAEIYSSLKILDFFPLKANITDMNFHGSTEEVAGKLIKLPKGMASVNYGTFSLSMSFNASEEEKIFCVHFLNSKTRDEFLDKLILSRIEHFQCLLPLVREEPEGGNEIIQDGSRSETLKCVSKQGSCKPDSKSSSIYLTRSNFKYPSDEQLDYLTVCVQSYKLIKPLTGWCRNMTKMDGPQLVGYFHSNVAHLNLSGEALLHVLWTNVVLYTKPDQEILSCVMLTSKAVYCVCDSLPDTSQDKDKEQGYSGVEVLHKSCGHYSNIPHTFLTILLSDLSQVNIGMFDQCIRLTGRSENTVCTLVTRDCSVTETFLQQLMSALSAYVASSVADNGSPEAETDFYYLFSQKNQTSAEGIEYTHPSNVCFCYPGEEAISDIMFIIADILGEPNKKELPYHIWIYILGYQLLKQSTDPLEDIQAAHSCSLILTDSHFCLLAEDLVSYPLPEFARELPNKPRHRIVEIHKIEHLKQVYIVNGTPGFLRFVFSDENEEVDVDANFEYFCSKEGLKSKVLTPEIILQVIIQGEKEKGKLLQLLKRQWDELHENAELIILKVNN